MKFTEVSLTIESSLMKELICLAIVSLTLITD